MNPKDENEVIGPRKPNKVNNSPWECKVSKRDEKTQRKQMGQGCPREKQKRTQKPISRKINGHVKPLKERIYTAGLKRPNKIESLQ